MGEKKLQYDVLPIEGANIDCDFRPAKMKRIIVRRDYCLAFLFWPEDGAVLPVKTYFRRLKTSRASV